MNNTISELIKKISTANNIYIASHVNPDGDSIGSILAMALGLRKINKNVNIIKTDEIPSDYLFLPNIHMIRTYDIDEEKDPIDLLVVLDCGDIDRLGKFKSIVSNSKFVINIDHHISNSGFGDINIVDEQSAATGELVFDLLVGMGIQIDKEIATCLYTAISTDTGSFSYDNVTSRTHEIVVSLINAGIDKSDINIRLYQSRSIERTNLFISSFSTLKTYNDNKIATVKVTQDMLKKANAKMEDTEGIISFIRDIKPVEVACLLKENKEKEIKISLRSKRFVDVSKICSAFNGGGHKRASGCTINESINDAERLIVEQIIKMW
ncbi:MAG: bifunctional oligoribonuclease/PAP phosphatase NrnA [Tissierellia bacterium]|jgi:phosphoesterase RecJ-like protein|nr:bifunctional oligoribonuclease/PAP phosphatase NrnA [Tissierellia bacterium]